MVRSPQAPVVIKLSTFSTFRENFVRLTIYHFDYSFCSTRDKHTHSGMVKSIPIVPSPLLFLPSLKTGSSLRHVVENFGAASRQSWPEHQNFPELAKVSLLAGHSPPTQPFSPQTAAEESNHIPFRILSNHVSAPFFWKVFVSCLRQCDSFNHIFAFIGTSCVAHIQECCVTTQRTAVRQITPRRAYAYFGCLLSRIFPRSRQGICHKDLGPVSRKSR